MTLPELLGMLDSPRDGKRIDSFRCWGEGAIYLDWGNEQVHVASAVVVEDTAQVLAIELFTEDGAYRWIETEFTQPFINECKSQGIDPNQSGIGRYIDVSAESMILLLGSISGKEVKL